MDHSQIKWQLERKGKYNMQDKKIYFNNEFEILEKPENDSIEVDEQIADTIIMLNKKGFKTKACCSGHYKEDTSYEEKIDKSLTSKSDLLEWINENQLKFLKEDDKYYYYEGKTLGLSCYVSFDENVVLPSYPSGFTFYNENNCNNISYQLLLYEDEKGFNKKTKELVEQEIEVAANNLRVWAQNLPEIN